MALAEFNLRQLLEAGVHFGHQTKRWNPLMEPYIYGSRNGIHILDLTQTVPLLDAALQVVTETVAKGGIVLFVGTKRQAQKPISEAAEKSAQYYMNHRWLGGTLTNWNTVSNSISRLKKIDEQLQGNTDGLTKKERLNIEREQSKLQASLGGIRDMGGTPDLVFVIDTNKESLAIEEAKKLGIPVVAILDTNSDPLGIDYPIPGNDDAARSIALYCDLVARAALDGMESQLGAAGVDIGELENLPSESHKDKKDAKESIKLEEDSSLVENEDLKDTSETADFEKGKRLNKLEIDEPGSEVKTKAKSKVQDVKGNAASSEKVPSNSELNEHVETRSKSDMLDENSSVQNGTDVSPDVENKVTTKSEKASSKKPSSQNEDQGKDDDLKVTQKDTKPSAKQAKSKTSPQVKSAKSTLKSKKHEEKNDGETEKASKK